MMITIAKPQPDEYPAYASAYYQLIPEGLSLIDALQGDSKDTIDFLRTLSEDRLVTPCAPGEWTVKEVFGHMMDQERVLVYRALRFARNDEIELATFDHEAYVKSSGANQRLIEGMVEEFFAVREASITLFASLDENAIIRSGLVGGNRFSVRALAWLTVGHELHHIKSIKQNYSMK